jgi:thioredoxin 1
MAKEFNVENWDQEVLKNSGVTVVDFWADWCGPCRVFTPIVEQLSEKMADRASVGKLDVDQNSDIASEAGIRGIPTLIIYKDGKEVQRKSGVIQLTELENMVEEAINL